MDETASQIRTQLRNLQDQLEEKEKEQASQDAADPEKPSPRPFKKPFPKPAPPRKKGPIGVSSSFNPVRIVLKKASSTAAAPIGSSRTGGVKVAPGEEHKKPPSWEVGQEPAAFLKSAATVKAAFPKSASRSAIRPMSIPSEKQRGEKARNRGHPWRSRDLPGKRRR